MKGTLVAGLLGAACMQPAPSLAGAPLPRDSVAAVATPLPDYDAIDRAISAGRLTQARIMLAAIGTGTAQDARYALALGRYYLAQRQDVLALEQFRRALVTGPTAQEAAKGAGMASLRLGRSADAREFLATIPPEQRDAESWNCLGIIAAGAHDWKAADEAFQKALDLAPKNATVLNNFGYSLIIRRRFSEAIGLLSRAVRAAPGDAVIRNNRQLASDLNGDYPRAAIASIKDDDAGRRLNNAGYAAWLNGDMAAARALLAQAIEVTASHYDLAERNLELVERSVAK